MHPNGIFKCATGAQNVLSFDAGHPLEKGLGFFRMLAGVPANTVSHLGTLVGGDGPKPPTDTKLINLLDDTVRSEIWTRVKATTLKAPPTTSKVE